MKVDSVRSTISGPWIQPTSGAIRSITWLTPFVVLCFVGFVAADALEAYNVGQVPIQWLARFGAVGLALMVSLVSKTSVPKGAISLLILFLWGVIRTLISSELGTFSDLVPVYATTSYSAFIGLRILVILAFLSTLVIVYWLLQRGYESKVIGITIWLACLVSLFALYVYAAQVIGFPEPPRSRIGTGGGEQGTIFTYAFHRAMGSFREPSHLAEWLITPFFLSLVARPLRYMIPTAVIGIAILLTGSLTAIVGGAVGFCAAILLLNPMRAKNAQVALRVLAIALLSLAIFPLITASYGEDRANLVNVVIQRMSPLVREGVGASNRAPIYRFVSSMAMPTWGAGLGNANLLLTSYLDSPVMVSFLSLYLNILFSLGLPGLIFLIIFLLRPLLEILARAEVRRRLTVAFLAAYLSWLIMFSVRSEEFSLMFALTFAMLAHEIRKARTVSSPETPVFF